MNRYNTSGTKFENTKKLNRQPSNLSILKENLNTSSSSQSQFIDLSVERFENEIKKIENEFINIILLDTENSMHDNCPFTCAIQIIVKYLHELCIKKRKSSKNVEEIVDLDKLVEQFKNFSNETSIKEPADQRNRICSSYLNLFKSEQFDFLRKFYTSEIFEYVKKDFVNVKMEQKKTHSYDSYFHFGCSFELPDKWTHNIFKKCVWRTLLFNKIKGNVSCSEEKYGFLSDEFSEILAKARVDPQRSLETLFQEAARILFKWEQLNTEMNLHKKCTINESKDLFESESKFSEIFNGYRCSKDFEDFLNNIEYSSLLAYFRYGVDNIIKAYKLFYLTTMWCHVYRQRMSISLNTSANSFLNSSKPGSPKKVRFNLDTLEESFVENENHSMYFNNNKIATPLSPKPSIKKILSNTQFIDDISPIEHHADVSKLFPAVSNRKQNNRNGISQTAISKPFETNFSDFSIISNALDFHFTLNFNNKSNSGSYRLKKPSNVLQKSKQTNEELKSSFIMPYERVNSFHLAATTSSKNSSNNYTILPKLVTNTRYDSNDKLSVNSVGLKLDKKISRESFVYRK